MNEFDVLVAGADQRQGLAVIRGLGSGGCKIFAAGPPNSIGFYSRFTQAFTAVPSSMTNKKAFAKAILKLAIQRDLPRPFVAGHRSRFGHNHKVS